MKNEFISPSSDHFVHGLGNSLQKPDWPVLCEGELSTLLDQHYEVGPLRAIEWRSPRPFSSAARISTAQGGFFIKRHGRALRSVADLQAEHHFMSYLAKSGMNVAQVVPTKSGATAFANDGWTYELHCAAPGEDLYQDRTSWTPFLSGEQAFEAGKVLAELHRAAVHYDAPARSARMLIMNMRLFGTRNPLTALKAEISKHVGLNAFFSHKNWQEDILERVVEPFHAAAYAALQTAPPLWGHGDWHGSNLLWSGCGPAASVSTVLDFGLADKSTALLDVATALERSMVPWLQMEHGEEPVANVEQTTCFLRGYAFVSGWGSNELSALADILPIAHTNFAFSEIDYFYSLLKNEENADLAYSGYLLGHSDWFGRAEGKRWLRHIKTLNL
ncbi:phosphotransferase enzyme family protein [Neokomagataea tanensis]|uniref:phosphotransferase enzyme family protein n=1 Tax=Neokomagataea TaxID=1223423 RepID=UPI0014770561|nr:MULTISPECIES: phosphotransferase [Neokomagataea]